MKTFNAPEFDVIKFNVADVITTSSTCDDDCRTFQGCPDDTCITDF